jgi:hypothetical protein
VGREQVPNYRPASVSRLATTCPVFADTGNAAPDQYTRAVESMNHLQLPGVLGLGNAVVLGLPTSFDLLVEIESAKGVKLATAFAHMTGWNKIRPSIERSTAKIQLLTG